MDMVVHVMLYVTKEPIGLRKAGYSDTPDFPLIFRGHCAPKKAKCRERPIVKDRVAYIR